MPLQLRLEHLEAAGLRHLVPDEPGPLKHVNLIQTTAHPRFSRAPSNITSPTRVNRRTMRSLVDVIEEHLAIGMGCNACGHYQGLKRSPCLLGGMIPFSSRLMVFASDVAKGKPDPAIYLEAAGRPKLSATSPTVEARRLGVDPQKCRAYEDGESGLQSAYAAGMQVAEP